VWARRAAIGLLVVGLAYVMFSIWDRDAFGRWLNNASPVPFFVAMAVLPALGLPISPFMLVAGATFGIWIGLIGTVSAVAVQLCIAYAIAHSALRPRLEALFARFDYKVPDFTAGGPSAWRFTAAVKLTPALPAFAKMYMLAITGVPFPIYFGVFLAITTAFAAAWIVLGDSLLSHDLSWTTIAAVAIVLLLIVALWWWRKRREVSGADVIAAT
jgi:uncharacterized membrane protein YdjX (TVP38/TMEM64 family)